MSFSHRKTDYELNELNKKNTHEGSPVGEFTASNHKFALGFWTATAANENLLDSPMLCMIVWTPEGWKYLGKLNPVWNDDLGMDMGTEEDDIRNYLWLIGQRFDPIMNEYLRNKGAAAAPKLIWQKILERLMSVHVVNDRIAFK